MRIFCDDGSTSTKLAFYREGQLLTQVTNTSFVSGNWNFSYGDNIFNYEVNGKKYAFNEASPETSKTTSIDYQYSDENLIAVHHALLQTLQEDEQPFEVELYVTLPLCEYFDENRQKNTQNIERKKKNLLREISFHDGMNYKPTFKIKKVSVSPESLTALYDIFTKDKVNDFETSLIIDLGGTTLDCGVVVGNFKQLLNVIAEPTLGTTFIIERVKKTIKLETNLGLSFSITHKLVTEVFNKNYKLLNSITNNDTEKSENIKNDIQKSIKELSMRVLSKIKSFDNFQRIYLIGGGANYIYPDIKSEFHQLKDNVILVPKSQTALVESIAVMVGDK